MSKIQEYELQNNNAMTVKIVNLGARVSSIKVPIDQCLTEMTVTYNNPQCFLNDKAYIGATVGPVSNRIENGQFYLNQTRYMLDKNDRGNCLHGGEKGFSQHLWQVNETTRTLTYLELNLESKHMEHGLPGHLNITVGYNLTEDNALEISYYATSTQDTLLSVCNHCYFNLAETSVDNLFLSLDATRYLPIDELGIPTGDMKSVGDGDFAFNSQLKSIGLTIGSANDPQIIANRGFDHCYVINPHLAQSPVATLIAKNTGIRMQVYTDYEGVQFYSGQHLEPPFKPYQGICIEAQRFPNAINNPFFPSPILKSGALFKQHTIYKFDHV
ncbi:aldose epimerase family protein [Pseudoalteromonas sp. MMG005]|uniref:aldose epimerase family protein n=1 Tax=Pseudoalteromonas sp. MMG005 TaxID=2822682 RepID=UPI001B39E4CC|nr:aldose epimerase family protein [Pseudoalteromonas sp. MMG005]MBQ4846680.1 galactose mutarotase [Pseudoalteromonas sp. MMG005]